MRDTSLYEPDRYWAVGITILRQLRFRIPLYPHMMRRHRDVFIWKWRFGIYNITRKCHNALCSERVRFQWIAIKMSVT